MSFFSYFNSVIGLQTQIILVSLLALVLGSFTSLITFRIRQKNTDLQGESPLKKTGKKIFLARSKCPNCGVVLKIRNLVPLFSWLCQRGKCSNCHVKISLRYPLIELSFLVSFLVIYFVLKRELSLQMLLYFAITGVLIAMCVFDLEQYFIPNLAQYFLTVFAAILVIHQGETNSALVNVKASFAYLAFGIAVYVFFYFTTGLRAIGEDDLKFFFVAGLLLGMKNFLPFMILSGALGIIFGGLWQKFKKDETFPFAPPICLAAFLCMLFGNKIDPVDLLGSLLFSQGF